MSIKKLLALLLCVAMVLSLAACAGAKDDQPADNDSNAETPADNDNNNPSSDGDSAGEKVLTVGWPYDPASLDPARASLDSDYRVLVATNEPLLRNAGGEVQPGSAESYEASDDLTEYTFHLRRSNVYSDGTPITAADFAYGLQRLLNPDEAYDQAVIGFLIKNGEAYYNGECAVEDLGIEVVDEYTLKLTTEYPAYPQNFCRWEFSPINQAKAEELGIEYGADATKVLTNGPFTATSWVRDSEIVLEKNPNYWNADAIKLDKVVLKINATGDTAVDMMMTGELDVAGVTTKVQADTLLDSGFTYEIQTNGVQCVHVNHAGNTPETGLFLSNVNFRKALSAAIDRDAMVATAYTTDIPATRMVMPNEQGKEGLFGEEYPFEGWSTSADPEKAQEYLALALEELGKTADEIPTFSILCMDSSSNMVAMNAIMDMWSQTLGIQCEIDAQPIQNMLQKMLDGEFDFWKGGIEIGAVDSSGLFENYLSTTTNYGYYSDEYDALYNAVLNATTWEARKDAMFELEQFFFEEMIDLGVTWISSYYVYSADVTGLQMDNSGINFVYADVTK